MSIAANAVPVAASAVPVVALVGNPNCGKTALFNALTGSRQKVANYPGVTVEKKVGPLTTPAGRTVRVVDLPGTYSLRARSPDEEVTRDVILGRRQSDVTPDLIVCVADASNLRLALRLALELKRVGRPVMLSLNMMDIARKRGIDIDIERLSRELGVPVVESVAVRRGGTDALLAAIDRRLDERTETTVADWRAPDAGALRVGQREADRIREALAQRAGGGFHARGLVALRMAGGLAVQLAEVLQLLQRQGHQAHRLHELGRHLELLDLA